MRLNSTILNTNKLYIRGIDFIEVNPGSLLNPNGNTNNYYNLFIHGCDPF